MSEDSIKRVGVLSRHLTDSLQEGKHKGGANVANQYKYIQETVFQDLPRFDPFVMESYLDPLRELKREVYSLLKSRPDLLPPVEESLSKEQHREVVRKLLRVILQAGFNPLYYLDRDYKKYFYLAECASLVDLSLMVKMGVQYSLWGGSVMSLGTEQHRRTYFDDIASFKLPGCFAMTELKHGSNVAALQTRAVFDVKEDEWIIHTPDEGAIKWWIGNAAEDGKAATVFARLIIPQVQSLSLDTHQDLQPKEQDFGVHAFVVPLRDEQGQTLPGVEIHDCGYKVGLNGVDNGAISFNYVRIPRTNLLDRFAQVDRQGKYTTPLRSPTQRFATTLGELTGGRVGLVCGSLGVLKGAITIAVRYSAQRQQFGPTDGPEISILDYKSHQLKLMPILATTYALHFGREILVSKYSEMKRTKDQVLVAEVHSLSAGLKAYTTTYTARALSICRECCGGHGYAAVNRLGALRSDHDIFQTFEGDNTVLLQQVAATLLKGYRNKFKGSPMGMTYQYLMVTLRDNLPHNPLVTYDTDPRHLRDSQFLMRALKYRTAKLIHSVASRLRHHSRSMGQFQAWNECLPHLLNVVNAHIEQVLFQQFMAGVDACVDMECRRSLKTMADLFALSCIQNDMMFRDEDFIAPMKAKAISKMIERLCGQVRGVALPLVDAFDIPDHILRAPIGLSSFSSPNEDVNLYKQYLETVGIEYGEHPSHD
eukprot:TRINITY_DN4623_c0_g1_i3.p1 TRINITY_DN4623_c0_g1~~TRINITY_DN4623_c0_g1_i3.p1  ORF type:complete len:734 (+),score=93.16 TRINITY_DN4623_c0_g1_i3:79-2202(+)